MTTEDVLIDYQCEAQSIVEQHRKKIKDGSVRKWFAVLTECIGAAELSADLCELFGAYERAGPAIRRKTRWRR